MAGYLQFRLFPLSHFFHCFNCFIFFVVAGSRLAQERAAVLSSGCGLGFWMVFTAQSFFS